MNSWFELKYTLRLLRNKQGFSALCVFVIAVGIAISIPLVSVSEFFGYVNIPLANSDRLVIVRQRIEGQGNTLFTDPYSYRRIEETAESYEFLSAFQQRTAVFSDGDSAEPFNGAWIEPRLLEFAIETPLLGRSLIASDNLPGAEPVAVIGFDLWQSYYAGAVDIIGRPGRINGENVTIVGVMPDEFGFPVAHDLWLPLQLSRNPEPGLERNLFLAGLLKEEATQRDAVVELDTILQTLSVEFPEFYSGTSGIVLPYSLIMITDGPIFGQLFIGMLATVLLLVCFNVGNLLAARNSERLSELAVRGAVGGTRSRIITQVLLESFIICVVAAMLGLALGSLGLNIIGSGMTNSIFTIPYWVTFSLGANDLVLLALITTGVWLLSAFYPAWKISRQDINALLSSDSQAITGTASGRFTKVLVTLEIVVSCFLLIICLSTIVAFYLSSRQDMGVNAARLLSARVNLSSADYAEPMAKQRFLQELRTEVLDSNRFEEVTYASAMAGQGVPRLDFDLEDLDVPANSRLPQVGLAWVDYNYFDLMESNSLQGRFFNSADNTESLPVVIVDELFAERYWPGESALGKQIRLQPEQGGEWLTVVGVVNHIIQGQPTAERLYESTVYRAINQWRQGDPGGAAMNSLSLAVRTPDLANTPIADLEQSLKAAVTRVNRDIPVSEVMPMARMMALGMEANQFFFDIMLWMVVATLVLSIVGIYGVVSRSVLARAMEIGIRRALGSSNLKIITIFLKQGLTYLSFGLIVGGAGGVLVLSILLQAVGSQTETGSYSILLYIVSTVMLLLGMMVFLASYIPSRKVVAMEPGEALHYE